MLVVIGIIAILASLLLPVFSIVRKKAKINLTKLEMKGVESAIQQYNTDYSRLPGVQLNPSSDVTYGYSFGPLPPNAYSTNSDLMAILMDTSFGANLNHALNPHRNVCYTPSRHSSDTFSAGLSSVDNQLRDAWGHPYVISLDLNGDGYCADVFYTNTAVSKQSSYHGYNGLMDFNKSDIFLLQGPVMIWSLGPDGQATNNVPANQSPNADNVLSWQ